MNIHLILGSGEHRQLTKQELMRLNKMLTNSSKKLLADINLAAVTQSPINSF